MPALTEIEGADVLSQGGTALGTVTRVLFHPSGPRAVALMIAKTPLLGVVPPPPAFVPWEATAFRDGAVRLAGERLPSRKKTETALGYDVDTTVIWRGMPVLTEAGGRIGTVGDASLADDGAISMLSVSTGAVGDLAHGRIQVPSGRVRGFDGQAIVVEGGTGDLEAGGGIAQAAAKGAVTAATAASETAKAAGEVFVDASYATGRAIAKASKSKVAKRARGAFKGVADAFREGRDGK